MTEPLRVTFVCTANICRSAYADVMARRWLVDHPGRVSIASAGTWGFDAQPLCPDMAAQAVQRGVDAADFASRRLHRTLVAESDLILTAEAAHRSFVLEEWPAAVRRTFTFAQVDRALAADPTLVGRAAIAGAREFAGPADRAGDIADPYRRGADAAATCATQIDGYLARLLPRLVG